MGRKRQLLVCAVLVAVLVNIIQFRAIDSQVNHRYAALNRYPTPDIIEIAYEASPHFQESYGLYVSLSEMFPKSRYTLPSSGRLSSGSLELRLFSLGLAEDVSYRSYLSDKADGLLSRQLSADILHQITSDNHTNDLFTIAASDGGGERGSPWAIIINAHTDRKSSKKPKEFILLYLFFQDSEDGQIIVLETSLLPDTTRQDTYDR